ncbi:hypothetical protein L6R52_23645 [Myxococcota bacterium]|nr:hypothetical protein [Myxococcota bacterium]
MRAPNTILTALGLASLVAACSSTEIATSAQPLAGVCVDDATATPMDAWMCGEARTIECTTHDGGWIDAIYVVSQQAEGGPACPADAPVPSDEGPFAVGEHVIVVTTDGLGTCTSTLTVVDTSTPTATPHVVTLWPPNHKLHTIDVDDCVTVEDTCDDDVDVHFTYVASDEPLNSTGDGNTDDDVVGFACERVELRAERKGNGDARVYTLGWRAEDDEGHVLEGECQVVVPHDQGGGAPVTSAEVYRVEPSTSCE